MAFLLDKFSQAFGKATMIETMFSVVAYSTCSISMVILNKLVIDTHKINFPMALLFMQALSAFVLVAVLKKMGHVDFPNMDKALLLKWLPLTALFVGMLGTSMLGLRTMSVQITVLIKNLALVLIALGYVNSRRLFHLFFKKIIISTVTTSSSDTTWTGGPSLPLGL